MYPNKEKEENKETLKSAKRLNRLTTIRDDDHAGNYFKKKGKKNKELSYICCTAKALCVLFFN